jgi:NAD(P)-dependent dehydrogenase (short-subunit alcohol dehydrogenase family)
MMGSSWEIEGRTALITGAARGIGASAAEELHGRGMNVVLAGLEPERLEELASTLGQRALAVECDVTSRSDLDDAVEAALERFGAIDTVIANAGVAAVGSVETSDPERWERVIEVNLLGVTRTVMAALPHVVARQGYVLPVSSLAAALPLTLSANYTAAKFGVNGFAQALRSEVASEGVSVGCAYWGAIDTDLLRRSTEDPASVEMMRAVPRFLSRPIPASRAGAAIARGVERRRRRVYAPRWILPMLLAPGLFLPLVERAGAAANAEAVRISNERDRAGAYGVATFVEHS